MSETDKKGQEFYCKINKEILDIIKKDPHCAQFFCTYDNIKKFELEDLSEVGITYYQNLRRFYDSKQEKLEYFTLKNYINKKLIRKYNDKIPTDLTYQNNHQLLHSVIHWGQRKLWISEVEFFTQYLNPKKNYTIVYVGAAPGTHTEFMIKMFPEKWKYILIDPRDFFKTLEKNKQVEIHKQFFNDKFALKLKKKYKDIIFICDIRSDEKQTSNYQKSKNNNKNNNNKNSKKQKILSHEDHVLMNMMDQKRWLEIMNPEYSQLKFRLPYNKPIIKYLKGDIYFQVWAKNMSGETRLVIKKQKNYQEQEYKLEDYENRLYYFNRVMRCQYYPHDYKVKDMDHCYDCSSEFEILKNYLKKYKKIKPKDMKKEVELLSQNFTDFITKSETNKFVEKFKIQE